MAIAASFLGDGAHGFWTLSFFNIWWYNVVQSFGKGLAIKDINASSTESETDDTSASMRSETFARHDCRVAQYWGEVCGYIRRRFGGGPPDPEEVVQTAFVKILANSNIDTIENARAFLYTTAYNTAIDMIRSQNRLSRFKASCESDGSENSGIDDLTPERVLLSKESFQIALDTINDMPDVERETLILYRIHGLTLVEIATRLGKSKTSVIRYLASAMHRLVEAARTFEHAH